MTAKDNDIISRQAALDVISRVGMCRCSTNEIDAVEVCLSVVKALPPVTAESKTGHWIDTDNYYQRWKCSECGCHTRDAAPPFCSNCGAKMQAESEAKKMTYEDIYDEFCKKFPNVEVEDYRPAVEMFIPQLSRGVPNAIIVWLKDGSKIIYIAESEVEDGE